MKIKHLFLGLLFSAVGTFPAQTQQHNSKIGDKVPEDLERIYTKGLDFLIKTQSPTGTWDSISQGDKAGTTSLCVLAFLAHGDDPNYGRYSDYIKKGIKAIIKTQKSGGLMGKCNYSHSYALLCLAEAYGVVMNPDIGPAMEKGLEYMLKKQNSNVENAWVASGGSADTSVSGSCLVALLAVRNAGLAVPQKNIDQVLAFFAKNQHEQGGMGYTSQNRGNNARSSIGALIYALSHKRNSDVYKKSIVFILENPDYREGNWNFYSYKIYYEAQAHFQSNMNTWSLWNKAEIAKILKKQARDGRIDYGGRCDPQTSTAMALLALAPNYRYLPIYER